MYNPLPLLSVRPSLASSLDQVGRDVEQYFADPATAQQALQNALDELHRAYGVLRMISLDGVAVYCDGIEKLLQEFSKAGMTPTAAHRDLVQRSLLAMGHYLDALADGASNAALRLFPQYQELLQARGMEMVFEVDLFFPELLVDLPPLALSVPLTPDAPMAIKAARGRYQQALLKWLRQDKPVDALQGMRTAIATVMSCMPQDQSRAFWWIAAGLMDCLVYDGLPPELNAKSLFSRIDMQMKALIEANPVDAHATTCEMLYLLARSHAVSETVNSIKQTYALDDYLPEEPPLPPSETGQVLDQMRALLAAARETWEKCTQIDGAEAGIAQADIAQAGKGFIEQADQLRVLAERLDRNTLQTLCTQIHTVAARSEDAEHIQRIAQDMAMTLLLLDSGIDQYSRLGSSFHEQVRILSQRLQASLMRTPEDEGAFDEVIALHSQMEERKIMVPLTNEMQNNLQHVEQVLTAFFSDTSKRDELAGLGKLLHQVLAAMHLLSLDQAELLLRVLQQTTENYAAGSNPIPTEMRAVAIALSAMAAYVQNLSYSQKPDVAPLNSALQSMQFSQQPVVAPATPAAPGAATVAATSAIPADWGEDDELREIFLEEAQEVLQILRANLEISQLHPDSREPLAIVRRGFHTLKGSSRMVGLADFGEVAWAIERAMNKWLETTRSATPGLLQFIGDAGKMFQIWLDALGKNEAVLFDNAALLATAQQIESGIDVLPTKEKPAEPTPAQPIAEVGSVEAPLPEPAAVESLPIELLPIVSQPQPVMGLVAEIPASEALPIEMMPVEAPVELVAEASAKPVETIAETTGVSPTLFSISTEEAAQHVAALQRHLAALRVSDSATITYDFMRAAHTLAGVNRTIGFIQVAELAHALELWLLARMEKPFALSAVQVAMLTKVIAALHDMGSAASTHHKVLAQAELIAQLQADKAVLPEKSKAHQLPEEPVVAKTPGIANTSDIKEKPALQEEPLPAEPVPPKKAKSEEVAPTRPATDARLVQDDMDEDLLPIYLEEAGDLYLQLGNNLRAWKEQPKVEAFGHTLQRSLHTMKGGARMVGAMRLGELIHRMEDHVVQTATQHDAAFWEGLENYFDRVGNALERLRTPTSAPAVAETKASTPAAPEIAAQALGVPVLDTGKGIPAPDAAAERAVPAAMMRVRSDVIDFLVNEAGEMSVARSRAEVEMRGFKSGLLELTTSIERLRKQLREIEIHAEGQMQARVSLSQEAAEMFDPLEFDRFTQFQDMTRSMNESVHDVQTVQQALLKNLDESSAALLAQSHSNRELQQRLMAIRMVPFSSISERLYRIVRQTARELGKKVNLDLRGGEVELDRSMLEKMTAPFEHLLRNAIAHGLEKEEERKRKGKPLMGTIRLSVRQENNEVDFELADDGAGLDIERLRQKALEIGMLQADEEVNENQIMQLIFSSGLSTAAEVTEISGRGVGMDVVRSDIVVLGGHIDVSSEKDKGARFVIRLPLTLAVAQTLMVQANHEIYAIHSGTVEQVQQVKYAELIEIYNKEYVEWGGNRYPLHNLTRLIGHEGHKLESRPYNFILLLRSGERRVAVHVDDLLGNQEVVVKNIGAQLARMSGIAGATLMGNGKVVLILNPIALAQRTSGAYKVGRAAAVELMQQTQPLVMVVDDSLTVRKVTSRMLIRAGYQVVTAKDGLDALEKLTEFSPAVMLLDIEMPRMDGFELTKRLRNDPKFRYLPIIIITSREAEKHRLYAQELGVNAYLGKPYQEDELLDHIKFYQEEELQQHKKFHEPDVLLQQIANFVSAQTSDQAEAGLQP